MFAIYTIAVCPIVFSAAGSCYKEVVGIVLALAVSVDYKKRTGILVLVYPIAVDQTVVVHKAVLVVAREVARSWYIPFIIRYVLFPQRYNGNELVQ